MNLINVRIEPLPENMEPVKTFQVCCFCEHLFERDRLIVQNLENINGPKPHCPFCIRHGFNRHNAKNVLILSFRGIIGYYYYQFYKKDDRTIWNSRTIWFEQLDQIIASHVKAGLRHPMFIYNPDNYLWFLDFNRIGKGQKKFDFEITKKIVRRMFDSFQLRKNFSEKQVDRLWAKFSTAIKGFYRTRKRPEGKKILRPTFQGIVEVADKRLFNWSRDFLSEDLLLC